MLRLRSVSIVVLLTAAFAFGVGKEGDDPIVGKAGQLVAGKDSRLAKVQAVHVFVRDEIGETGTKYG